VINPRHGGGVIDSELDYLINQLINPTDYEEAGDEVLENIDIHFALFEHG
jgi:hypothetical protein